MALITYRMPAWFPCFLSTLVAFALSIRPAFSLRTLPADSGLHGISPGLAILAFTGLGFAWGVVLSWTLAGNAVRCEISNHEPE